MTWLSVLTLEAIAGLSGFLTLILAVVEVAGAQINRNVETDHIALDMKCGANLFALLAVLDCFDTRQRDLELNSYAFPVAYI